MWNWVRGIACAICQSGKTYGKEIPSPRDIIAQSDIVYLGDKQIVTIGNVLPKVWLTTVADTNSMDGTIDIGHTMILSNNKKYLDKVDIGDIVVWQKWVLWVNKLASKTIMHQIIAIAEDDKGWFCYTQGINCPSKDPWKIRRKDIMWIALGVIW